MIRLDGAGGTTVAFSSDGARLLTAGSRYARVWNTRTWRPVTPLIDHKLDIAAAAISPKGDKVAIAAGTDAWVRNVEGGAGEVRLAHPGAVMDVVFSADGKLLATGCADCRARVWDPATGKVLAELKHETPVHFVSFSPDGRALATGTDPVGPPDSIDVVAGYGDAFLWDVATKHQRWTSEEWCHGRPVFTADGDRVAIPGQQETIVYNSKSGDALAKWWSSAEVGSIKVVAFDRKGDRLLVTGGCPPNDPDPAASVLEMHPAKGDMPDTPDEFSRIRGFVENTKVISASIDASGNKAALITASSRTSNGVWDVQSGKQLIHFEPDDLADRNYDEYQEIVAFSPNGAAVAVGCTGTRRHPANFTLVWEGVQRP